MQKYVRDFGLPDTLTTAQIEELFDNHDAHGNDPQVADFEGYVDGGSLTGLAHCGVETGDEKRNDAP